MLKTEQLEIFLIVCKMNSFNLAAKSLNISHQMISKTIRTLEIELNSDLFLRTNQGVTTTEYGEKLRIFAEKALNDIKTLMPTEKRASKKEIISVLTTMGPANSFLLSAVNEIGYYCPNVIVNLYHRNREEIIKQINQEKEYIGFITISDDEQIEKVLRNNMIGYEILATDKTILVCSKEHPLAIKSGAVSLKEIAKYPITIYLDNENADSFLLKAMKKKNIKYNLHLKTNNILSLENALLNTQSVGTSTKLIKKCNNFFHNTDNLAFKTISAIPELKILVIYNKKTQKKANHFCRLSENIYFKN